MEDIEKFAAPDNPKVTGKEWHGKSNPQYNPEVHPSMVREIFKNGGSYSTFISACNISSVTFYDWLKKFPEFKEQYEIGLHEGKLMWEIMPLAAFREKGLSLNFNYWNMIYRERYKASPIRLEKAESNTTEAKLDAAWRSLQKGGITAQEYNQIASGLANESRIVELELKKKELEQTKENGKTVELDDEMVRKIMLVKSGKARVIEND